MPGGARSGCEADSGDVQLAREPPGPVGLAQYGECFRRLGAPAGEHRVARAQLGRPGCGRAALRAASAPVRSAASTSVSTRTDRHHSVAGAGATGSLYSHATRRPPRRRGSRPLEPAPGASLGVSAHPASVTAEALAATRLGVSLGAATARRAGLGVEAVHARAAGLTGDLASTDAMWLADVTALIDQGRAAGQRFAAQGLVCLGEVGIGNTTVAAALSCVLLGLDPESAVGLSAGADAAILTRMRDVVTDAVSWAQATLGDSLDDPRVLAAALGGPEIALLTGVTLGAASCSVPVVLDGLATAVAALLAVRLESAVQSSLVAGQRSRERAHAAVLSELGLEPLLQLRLRAGEGVGAGLAAQMLLTAIRARQAVARVRATGD
jgi:nicotinate-nucleotide--dimethylbenzimidazole phosphoribosyltransferase